MGGRHITELREFLNSTIAQGSLQYVCMCSSHVQISWIVLFCSVEKTEQTLCFAAHLPQDSLLAFAEKEICPSTRCSQVDGMRNT